VDELIRDRMHEALEVEPPPFGLRSRVIGSVPMNEESVQRPRARSFQWAGQWATSLVAILLALAVIVTLVYTREALISPCLLYTSPSPRDLSTARLPSSA